MNMKSTTNYDQMSEAAFGHAVVIGSGIAGLTAARVLTDHFAQVTIIERDRLPDHTAIPSRRTAGPSCPLSAGTRPGAA